MKLRKTLSSLIVLSGSVATGVYGQSYHVRSVRGETESMSFLAWMVLGLIAGYIGSKIVNRRGEGIVLDILLGIVGAFVGGWLFHVFGEPGVSGLNLYSLFVAVIGSVAFLLVYHALIRRRSWYN